MSRLLFPQLLASRALILCDDLGGDLIDNRILTLRQGVARTKQGRSGDKKREYRKRAEP